MSDASQGPGWWLASDGKWYPPNQALGYIPPPPPAPGDVPTGVIVPPPPGSGATPPMAGVNSGGSSGRPTWLLPLIACGALFALLVIAGALGAGKKDSTLNTATSSSVTTQQQSAPST